MNQFTEGSEGVIYDMPDADYRKAPGVSNSMLKKIDSDGEDPGSPAHFKEALSKPSEDTDAMFFGRMVHSRILTPDCPLPAVEVIPDTYPAPEGCTAVKQKKCQVGDPLPWHGAAKFCKEWQADRQSRGIRPVTSEQLENMNGVVNSIAKNPIAAMALKSGKAEVSLFKKFFHGSQMLLKKARLDWVPVGPSLVDIKTSLDARKDSFSQEMFKRRYYVQASYYLDIWNELNPDDQKTNFVFIVVEKFAPFAVSIIDVVPKALETGRGQYRANLRLLLTCMELDHWPAYGEDVQSVDLPGYAYKKGLEVYA